MSRLDPTRLPFLACLAAALLLAPWAAQAVADEPIEDFPPPKEGAAAEAPETAKPPAAEAQPPKPPAPKPPAERGGAWSGPAVTPGTGSSLGSLPPPRVVKRRSTARTIPATPRPAAPVAPRPVAARPSTAPAAPMAPRPPAPVARPPATPRMAPPPPPPPAATGMPAARPARTAVGGGRVISVSKTHNVQVEGGSLALRLGVDYELHGQAGRDVYVAVWFTRADDGAPIRAGLPGYADASGQATLQTRTVRVSGPAARFNAVLSIPYAAFPVAGARDAYDVQARVQVLRQEGAERVTILATGGTQFRVYGYAEPGS